MPDRPHARFLATLSHDLRGGLHAIQLALELLGRDVQDARPLEQVLESVEMARRAVNDCAVRTDRLISLRRLADGLMSPRLAEVDVAAVIGQAIEQACGVAEEYRQRIAADLPDRWIIQTDARLLALIVGGILDHALRRTAGPIMVTADPAQRSVRIVPAGEWPDVASLSDPAMPAEPPELEPALTGLHAARLAAQALGAALGRDPCGAGLAIRV